MRGGHADEIVPAVFRRAENGAVGSVAVLGQQRAHGLDKGGGGHGGAVGVDEANGGKAAVEQVADGGEQALAEAVSALGHEQRGRGQDAREGRLLTDRRVGDDAVCRGLERGEVEAGEGVPEEVGVEKRGLLGAERRAEARFDLARGGRLSHDGERAAAVELRRGRRHG